MVLYHRMLRVDLNHCVNDILSKKENGFLNVMHIYDI